MNKAGEALCNLRELSFLMKLNKNSGDPSQFEFSPNPALTQDVDADILSRGDSGEGGGQRVRNGTAGQGRRVRGQLQPGHTGDASPTPGGAGHPPRRSHGRARSWRVHPQLPTDHCLTLPLGTLVLRQLCPALRGPREQRTQETLCCGNLGLDLQGRQKMRAAPAASAATITLKNRPARHDLFSRDFLCYCILILE